MPVSTITPGNGPAAGAATVSGEGLGRQDFLQLLVTQLRNQDPLNPIGDREFIAQMAQLSALEATNDLAGQVRQMVSNQQQLSALQLVGHKVEYQDAAGKATQGTVTGVRLDGSAPLLLIDQHEVPIDQVQTVL
jgi:flagellar basal-body rod modification protein FlgD